MLDAFVTTVTWLIYALVALGVMVILGIGAMVLYAAYLEATKLKTFEGHEDDPKMGYWGFRQDRGGPR